MTPAAAQWVSLYWGGLTAGRLVSGFLAIRFNNQQMIRIGELTVLLGVVCLLFALAAVCGVSSALFWLELAALQFILLYASYETPVRFGKEDAQSMMGFQMAVCYTGSTLLPPFFGLVATKVNVGLLPVFFAGVYCDYAGQLRKPPTVFSIAGNKAEPSEAFKGELSVYGCQNKHVTFLSETKI